MKRKILRYTVFAMCVCLLLCMGVPAYAGGSADAKYIITISPPATAESEVAFVTVRLEDVNGTGFIQAAARLDNGSWRDITESLRSNGWAQLEIDRNGKVYVAVTDHTGKAHLKSLDVECFGGIISTEPEPPEEPAAPEQSETPAVPDNSGSTSVTPTEGSGTVTENSVKSPGEREFFTIQSDKGNDFYIVVDKEKQDQNVYLLSEVTEDDLLGLTKTPQAAQPDPEPVTPAPEPAPPEAETPAAPEKESDTGMIVVIVLVMAVAGGAGYYFKIVRPKRNAVPEEEYIEDDDTGDDEIDDYDYDTDDEKGEQSE